MIVNVSSEAWIMEYKDAEQESVTKTWAGEKAKLSQMSFGDKLSYIFTYYKLHIIIAVVLIAAIAWLIHHQMTYVSYKLYGVIINSYEYNENVIEQVEDEIGMTGHDGFSFIGGLSGDPDSNSISYYNQIDVYTVSGQMDFAFTDQAGVEYLCDLGTPYGVTEELPSELMELWNGRQVSFSQRNANDDTYFDNYAAIDISGTKVHDYFGLDDNMTYLVITNLSDNQNYMDSFCDYLYKIEAGEIE